MSRSSAEAEYRTLACTTSELVWITQLLADFQILVSKSILIFCDNLAALHIASNPIFQELINHIEIDCHFLYVTS